MFKRVDNDKVSDDFEGFYYINKNGNKEFVAVDPHGSGYVTIRVDNGDKATVYAADLDNLIKALKCAEAYLEQI